MLNSMVVFLVLAYFAICLYIGYISGKKETSEGFFLDDRKVGLFRLTATIAASFIGANFLIVYTSFVYLYGISAFWMFIGYLIGFFIFSRFGVFLKERADKKRYYTLSDYFQDRHGKGLAILTTFGVFIMLVGALINQYIGGAKILTQISGWSYPLGLILMASVVLIYLLLGGFRSVVNTDVFQYLMIILLPILLIFSVKSGILVNPKYFNIFNAGVINILAFLLYGIFANFVFADLWQRVYAAKDKETVKKAFPLAGISIAFVGLLFTYLGLIAKTAFASIDADLAAVYSFTQLIPPVLLGVYLVFLFAVIMSSADTILFVLAMNVSQDIINRGEQFKRIKELGHTKLALIVFSVLAVLVAIIYPKMAEIVIVYSAIGLSLSPLVVISWLSKNPNVKSMKLAFIIPVITVLILVFWFGIIHPGLGLLSIVESALVYLLTFKIV